MIVPNFEYAKPTTQEGEWSDQWRQLMTVMLQNMQTALSDKGWQWPIRTAADIAAIAALATTPNGTVWYDSTNDQFKGKRGGVLVTFTTV